MRLVVYTLIAITSCAPAAAIGTSAGIVAGSSALAYSMSESTGSTIGLEVTAGSAGALIPAGYFEWITRERGDPDGVDLKRDFLVRLKDAALHAAPLPALALAPAAGTWIVGERDRGGDLSGRRLVVTYFGSVIGMTTAMLVLIERPIPRWLRLALTATMIGGMTTFFYQVGGVGD